MLSRKFLLGLLTFSLSYAVGLTQLTLAQCVQGDVSLQYNISGSRQPTARSNNVTMNSDKGCVGNASVTTGIQGNIGGTNPVEQHRQVRHRQIGGTGNGTGIEGKTVQIRSNVGVDVYNPVDNFTKP